MFDAQAATADLVGDEFEFRGLDGDVHKLPNIGSITQKQAVRFQLGDVSVLQELAPDAYDAVMELPVAVAEQLSIAWLEHGGLAGKSGSALPPTNNAGGPSPKTSPQPDSTPEP